jgi:hypothetical protein
MVANIYLARLHAISTGDLGKNMRHDSSPHALLKTDSGGRHRKSLIRLALGVLLVHLKKNLVESAEYGGQTFDAMPCTTLTLNTDL